MVTAYRDTLTEQQPQAKKTTNTIYHDKITITFQLFFSHHYSVEKFEVELSKFVIFPNIFNAIEKGV